MKASNGCSGPPAIFLMGPTAAGKTALAVELVRRLPCDIVSVDSALVYRGMDIGTAKPGADLLAVAPHRLIDVCEPSEVYSAARFRADARRAMDEISTAGRIPLLVGGTMLYYRALERGLADLPPADVAVRRGLETQLRTRGLAALHERLAQVDPAAAQRIHPNDSQRTLRALEVWEITRRPLSQWHAHQPTESLPYRMLKIVAFQDKVTLRERINRRFDAMLEAGFLGEVERLLGRHEMTPELPSMRAVGYRQAIEFFQGAYAFEAFVNRATHATWQLAKRQMTWLRSRQDATWVDAARARTANDLFLLAKQHLG
jgi:tRNA dimethylallyltransferase